MTQYIKICLGIFTYNSLSFMAHDCQRQRLANNVTKVTEDGRGWEEKYGKQTLNTSKNLCREETQEYEVKVQRKTTGREGYRMKQKK